MIILDTNVVSEPIKLRPDLHVLAWLDRQAVETLYLTATSLSELLVGVQTMPSGKRRDRLAGSLQALLEGLFGSRVLAFDGDAAVAYASLIGRARLAGRTISVADGQIAAIADVHGFAVATRDIAPFAAVGARIINPWDL